MGSSSGWASQYVYEKKKSQVTKNGGGYLRTLIQRQRENELPLMLKIQKHRNKFWDWYFWLSSNLGEEISYITILPLTTWLINRMLSPHLCFLLALSVGIGNVIKNSLSLPRPPSPPVWVHTFPQPDHGMPSTHTMSSICIPWYFIIFFWNHPSPIIPPFLSVPLLLWWSGSVIASRVYNGHHYPLDVIMGTFLSTLILAVYSTQLHDLVNDLYTYPTIWTPILMFMISTFILVIHPIPSTPTPAHAESALVIGTSVGGPLGVWFQHYLDWPRAYLSVDGAPPIPSPLNPVLLLTLRFVFGAVFVAMVRFISKWFFLKVILWIRGDKGQKDKNSFKNSETEVMVKYLTYTMIGFSVSGIVPNLYPFFNLQCEVDWTSYTY